MSRLMVPVYSLDHVLGDPGAPVTLLEYADFECPHCRRAHLVIQEVLPRVGREVRFVFRHFPLAEVHVHALSAAEAAEAAGAQGKFWPMHHVLFEHQDALETKDLLGYAEVLRLDRARFIRELGDHAHLDKVKGDFRGGVRSGVNGTPTFFIDGVRYDESRDSDTLTIALQAAIRAKQSR